jgi:hypothetical protein
MRVLLAIVLGVVGLVLIALLHYLLRRHPRSLNVERLRDSAIRIPTVPMMDPDWFAIAEEQKEAVAP